jgi:uncharacterized protein (TIGR02246 family)
MGSSNEDLVREGYAAFSAGDLERLGELMAPDVVHTVPGDNPTSGEHKGQEAVFAMYGQLFELTDGTLQVELVDVQEQGDKVVARHRSTGSRGTKTLDVGQTIEFTIEDGKIARLDESSDDQAAEDDFWS